MAGLTVIYVDTLFLLNAIVDYLLLLCSARLAGERLSRLRFALGALLGGLYAVALFLPGFGFLGRPLCRLSAAVLMVLTAFGGCRRLLRYGLVTLAGMTVLCFGAVQLLAPQIVHAFLGDENPALNLSSVDALRRYGLCYLMVGFNVLMGGFLTAVERPRPAICISVGRGLALQAGALLLLAAVWGGSVIWFAPVISEALCLVMALVFMTRFWRKSPDTVQV